jgi:hypothetical protein
MDKPLFVGLFFGVGMISFLVAILVAQFNLPKPMHHSSHVVSYVSHTCPASAECIVSVRVVE